MPDISPWYNADFVRRAVPLYILKTFGLPISDVQPTGPFVYATVFLADVGMIGTPWLYIGKRMDPSDQSYLGSGRRLRECIEEMGEIMFVRYTVVSLPLGSTSGDLESAEASVLRRFQAAKDKRLFNIINS